MVWEPFGGGSWRVTKNSLQKAHPYAHLIASTM